MRSSLSQRMGSAAANHKAEDGLRGGGDSQKKEELQLGSLQFEHSQKNIEFDDFELSQKKEQVLILDDDIEFGASPNLNLNPPFDLFGVGFVSSNNNQVGPAPSSLVELDPNQLNLSQSVESIVPDNPNGDIGNDMMLQLLENEGGSYGSQSQFRLSQDSFGLLNIDAYPNGITERPLGSENICFEKFTGYFDFEVTPVPTSGKGKSKSVWSEEHNKFFCELGTFEFNIKMNFERLINPEKYAIRVVLINTDPEYQDQPVVKCMNCSETEKKILNEEQIKAVLHHIVRGPHEDKYMTYYTSEQTKFRYSMIALRMPEPGSTTILQKLAFTCRSSCKSSGALGINRRHTALVFTLMNHYQQVLGRSVINLRICSAPARDFKSEFGKEVPPAQQKKKRKQSGTMNAPPNKVRVEAIPFVAKSEEPAPSTSKKMDVAVQNFDMGKAVDAIYQSSQESSSQESMYELDEKDTSGPRVIKLKTLARECRRVLNWLHCADPIQRAAAVQVFESLKFTEKIVSSSKATIKEVQARNVQKEDCI